MSVVVIFRSRLRPEAREEYATVADEIDALAQVQPGILGFKTFAAADGERVTISEFVDEGAVKAWRDHPRHREAQQRGRDHFYAEYRLQVCTVERDYGLRHESPTE